MIRTLHIRDLGVIREATLDLAPGLTVVTGETGAGKTMVVTALGLLLGARADAGAVREGASEAVVEGLVALAPDGAAAARIRDAGGAVEDGETVLTRTVAARGRSRAHVGGRAAPVAVLVDLAERLAVVHGQSDQLRLRDAAAQRDALDRSGGASVAEPLAHYREVYDRWREVRRRHAEISEQAAERRREAELLRLGLAEIEAVDPQPGEDVTLRAEAERLSHVEDLRLATTAAHQALVGTDDDAFGLSTPAAARDGGAMSGVDEAGHRLGDVGGVDERLDALRARVTEIGYLVTDVAGELSSYTADLDADPGRLEAVEHRLADLQQLTRKYGETVDDVLAWSQSSAARFAELDGDETTLDELAAEEQRLAAELDAAAATLSEAREAAAQRLSAAVDDELHGLAMPHAHLEVQVGRTDDYTVSGRDEVGFLLSPHPGARLRPLAKGASGGELSRVMLAVEVVLAAADRSDEAPGGGADTPTFVFDEVDSGVGGAAAAEIGRRLARLAAHAQVVVVTHLPQVAAWADRHVHVLKTTSDDGAFTASDVSALDRDGRVTELARMLAGHADSAAARTHAAELLDTAAADKSGMA